MAKDQWGIDLIYPTKPGGEEWYINMTDPESDSRFEASGQVNKVTVNSDGTLSCDDNDQVRLNAFTSAGYDSGSIVKDHSQLDTNVGGRGYMMDPKDWHNFEGTIFFKLKSSSQDDQLVIYGRGGKHNGTKNCEGCAYKADIFFSGKTRFAKEQWHSEYVYTTVKDAQISPIKNRMIGMKFMCYDKDDGNGKTSVKLELWESDQGDESAKFTQLDEYTDKPGGGWGKSGKQCNGAEDQVLTWGGPVVAARWDNVNDADFKWFSVREIVPTASKGEPAETQCPSGKICPTLRVVFRIASFVSASCGGEVLDHPPSNPPPVNPPGDGGGGPGGASTYTKYFKFWYNVNGA